GTQMLTALFQQHVQSDLWVLDLGWLSKRFRGRCGMRYRWGKENPEVCEVRVLERQDLQFSEQTFPAHLEHGHLASALDLAAGPRFLQCPQQRYGQLVAEHPWAVEADPPGRGGEERTDGPPEFHDIECIADQHTRGSEVFARHAVSRA